MNYKNLCLITLVALTTSAHAEGLNYLPAQTAKDAERMQACVHHRFAQAQLVKNKAQLQLIAEYEATNGASEVIHDLRKQEQIPGTILNYGVTTGATVAATGAASIGLRRLQDSRVVVKAGAKLPYWPVVTAKKIVKSGVALAAGTAVVSILVDKFYVNADVNIARREMLEFLDSTENENKRATREQMKLFLKEENRRLLNEQEQLNAIIMSLLPENVKDDPTQRCEIQVVDVDRHFGAIH